MALPIIIAAALIGAAGNKNKSDFQAVKGRKKKDGSTGKAYIRKKSK
jgi:hypothetical protein